MFNSLKGFYNQNRKKIILIVLAVVSVIVIVRVANYLAKVNSENRQSDSSNETLREEELKTKSIISDKSISETTATVNNNAIDQFINYCNKGDIDNAYNMLSTDCKKVVYNNDENNFKNGYYDIIFSSSKEYEKDNWITNDDSVTYRIDYKSEALSSGGKMEGNSYADYITVVYEDNQAKLNISNFVGKYSIDKTYEDDNIKINIASKNIFMEYETYEISFINKSSNNMKLYGDSSKWYAKDKNSNQYNVAISEIAKEFFNIEPQNVRVLNVKFIKTYNPEKELQSINFENMMFGENLNTVTIAL